MHIIENEILKIEIAARGAELKSIFHKGNTLDYMWSGDPAIWGKTSPVLFPIVGSLKENQFKFKGKEYSMSRHGFARDRNFSPAQQDNNSICFTLSDDEESLAIFPFPFSFSIIYTLEKNCLSVTYQVQNTGDQLMPFSVGGHPAFKLPLVAGTSYNDYQLKFEKNELTGRWPISANGLIEAAPQPLLNNTDVLPLKKQLFEKDAIVLKHLESSWVQLSSPKTPHGFKFHFPGFPYLGLWAAPGADFVCIEPWCGIADSVDADGNILHKEGVILLPAGEKFTATWKVELW